MFGKIKAPILLGFPDWAMRGIGAGWVMVGLFNPLQGADISAYAKPVGEYIHIYTLDHEYETTLFRSESFEALAEAEEGYIISLQLAGKQKLVLLPFENRERKIAEKKYRGVGVTYTAYLSFTQGYLPFFADQYYEVLKREKGMLLINYKMKGFQKLIEVPEQQFEVKTAFEYHLENSLAEIRLEYRSFAVDTPDPKTWEPSREVSGPGTFTESPTHVGWVARTNLANNYQSIRTAPATQLADVLKEVRIGTNKLMVVPIVFTHESANQTHYFVRIKGYDRPVLIKDFILPQETEGYSKVVRVADDSGQSQRFLEVLETVNIEFYPDYRFVSNGDLVAVRKSDSSLFLVTPDGEYVISAESMELLTPKEFLARWEKERQGTGWKSNPVPSDALLQLPIPPTARSFSDWRSIQKLQALVEHEKQFFQSASHGLQHRMNSLSAFESVGENLGLSFQTDPARSADPPLNQFYFNYWKAAFTAINNQAAAERNQAALRRQILRSKVLVGETSHQALIDFLSEQIYTFSNYLPAPLNRINQLETNPPLASSALMVFNFPVNQAFKLNPDTLEPLALPPMQSRVESTLMVLENYQTTWLLDISDIHHWQAAIIARMEEVFDPVFRKTKLEILAAEKQKRIEIARQRLLEAQSATPSQGGWLDNATTPWIAFALWCAVILVTNAGFLAVSRVMPLRHS